jgi:hypothetical protein
MGIFCGEEYMDQPEAIGEALIQFVATTLGGGNACMH